jgi:quercetin dioxygenase-like cupin family protein
MLIRSWHNVESRICDSDDAEGVKVRVLLGREQGAPRFTLSLYEVEPGGYTPFQATVWEHEMFVLEGRGVLKDRDQEHELGPGDAVLVPPGEMHQVRAEDGPLRFLCLAPRVDRLGIGEEEQAGGAQGEKAGGGI